MPVRSSSPWVAHAQGRLRPCLRLRRICPTQESNLADAQAPCPSAGEPPGPGAPTRARSSSASLHPLCGPPRGGQPVDRGTLPRWLGVEGRVEGRHHTGERGRHQVERCGGHRQKRACRCCGEIGAQKAVLLHCLRCARGQAPCWPGVSGTLAAVRAPWRGPTATTTHAGHITRGGLELALSLTCCCGCPRSPQQQIRAGHGTWPR